MHTCHCGATRVDQAQRPPTADCPHLLHRSMKFLSANARLITLLLLLFVASTDGFATGPTILGYPGTRQIFNQPATSCPAVLRPNALVGPRMKMEPEGTVKKIKSGWNTAIPAGDPTALPPQWVSSKPKPIQVEYRQNNQHFDRDSGSSGHAAVFRGKLILIQQMTEVRVKG